jgi:hypothetical protein
MGATGVGDWAEPALGLRERGSSELSRTAQSAGRERERA